MLLATEMNRDDNAVQDQVIKLSTSTGSVTRLVDFGELFADYKAFTTHAGTDESDSSSQNRWDWLHCNTIQLLDDGSALFSARETSTMIKVDDLESDPTLDYMLGEPSVWSGTDEASSFLTKDGDFPIPADSIPSHTSPMIRCLTASITCTCSITISALR